MNYQWHYNRLIETRKFKNRESGVYYEKHHILPRSMCGDDSENNLVYLTAREHFLAHWLLWRIHRNRQTAFAFWNMCTRNSRQEKSSFSSISYQEAKESWINTSDFKGEKNPMFGRKHSEKTRQQLSIKAKNRTSNGMKDRKHTEESIIKMRENRKGTSISEDHKQRISEHNTGKKVTAETREKMGAWQRGRIISEEVRQRMREAARNRKNKNTSHD